MRTATVTFCPAIYKCANCRRQHSQHLIPPAEQAMPQEIRELREESQDVSGYKTVIERIVARFGRPY